MSQYDEPFYFGELIGSAKGYHRPDCHIVNLIYQRNRKRLRNSDEAASLGLKPCPHCNPPISWNDQDSEPVTPPQQPKKTPVTARDLADIRRQLLRILDTLESSDGRIEGEAVGARIGRLTREGIIPRTISATIRLVTEMRNAAEYENKTLSASESLAVESAWQVIQEWEDNRHES